MSRGSRASEPLSGCATCQGLVKYERIPDGDSFTCPNCGANYHRLKQDSLADELLDSLLGAREHDDRSA
jgi:hypothetical protein